MQGDIIAQGAELMLYGMGTVVLFLALLVVATTAMSRIVARFFPEPVVMTGTGTERQDTAQGPIAQATLVAAIGAAIHRHRQKSSGGRD